VKDFARAARVVRGRTNLPACSDKKGTAMTNADLTGSTAIVTGASRGFGRATAIALAHSGAHVVGVARSQSGLQELHEQLGEAFTPVIADAADPGLPAQLLGRFRPRTLVLNAGATPAVASLSQLTWASFSNNWYVDVRHVFQFVREALVRPLERGSTVISLSSGAAIGGSPLSGGYAGAKTTVKFISSYAGIEAQRNSLGIRFVSLLPQITPGTDLGSPFVAAYARSSGLSQEQFLEQFGTTLSVDQFAKSIVELVSNDEYSAPAYLLAGAGMRPLE
jgi:NAD(P)-dependent dehydrogenase (short-subunit alcohol dehydrogenase family)